VKGFELCGVGGEVANALSQFLGGAGILVYFSPKGFFVEIDFFAVTLLGGFYGYNPSVWKRGVRR